MIGYYKTVYIGVTGHRSAPDSSIDALDQFLKLRYPGPAGIHLISGAAQGWDSIAAKWAKLNNVPYTLILPFDFHIHTNRWGQCHRDELQDLINHSDETIEMHDHYSTKHYLERDRLIVDKSDHMVAWWSGNHAGGTFYTVKYAGKMGKRLDNLYHD